MRPLDERVLRALWRDTKKPPGTENWTRHQWSVFINSDGGVMDTILNRGLRLGLIEMDRTKDGEIGYRKTELGDSLSVAEFARRIFAPDEATP
jgi:hypothetical protein